MKRVFMVLGIVFFAAMSANAKSVYLAQSNTGIKIYNDNNPDVITGPTFYVNGHWEATVSSRTTSVTYRTYADSMSITSVGGLYPGTTWFEYADGNMTTLTEFLNYANFLSTTTEGIEGGIVVSTPSTIVGGLGTTQITAGLSGSCYGSDSAVTLTLTLGQTSTLQVNESSLTFKSTNGLYPGTSEYVFLGTETLAIMKSVLESWPATTPGVDGTLNVTIPNGVYDLNKTSDLAIVAPQSIFGESNTATLSLDSNAVKGMSYIIPAGDAAIYLTNLVVNATYASGSLAVNIYDGSTTSTEQIRKETGAATTVDKLVNIPLEGFRGSMSCPMRIDIVGSAGSITSAFLNLVYNLQR